MWALVYEGKIKDIIRRPQSFRDNQGRIYPASVFENWSSEKLRAIGIYPMVTVTKRPSIYHRELIDTETFEMKGDRVERSVQYEAVDLETARGRTERELRIQHIKDLHTTFEFNGMKFKYDTKFKSELIDTMLEVLADLIEEEENDYIMTLEGNLINLTARQVLELYRAMRQHQLLKRTTHLNELEQVRKAKSVDTLTELLPNEEDR